MSVRWPPVLVGLAISFALLVFVTRFSVFGVTCYAVGGNDLFGDTRCLAPSVYWGAWILALVFLLFGIRPTPDSEDAQGNFGRGLASTLRATIALALVGLGLTVGYWYYATRVEPPNSPLAGQSQSPGASPVPTNSHAQPGGAQEPPQNIVNSYGMRDESPAPAIGPDGLPIAPVPPAIGPDGLPVNPSSPTTETEAVAPESGPPLPVPGKFRWSGVATQSNTGRTHGVTIIFDQSGNADIAWPDVGCGGTLTYLETVGVRFRYAETITYGKALCVNEATVTLTPATDGSTLAFVEDTAGATVSATLRPF